MAEDISDYGQEVFISVSVIPEKTKSLDYILPKFIILSLIPFCARIFCKNRVLNFINLFFSIFVFEKLETIQLLWFKIPPYILLFGINKAMQE